MQPAITSAIKGIRRNINRLNRSASRLSGAGCYRPDRDEKPVNITREMIHCMAAEKSVRANLESLRAAWKTTGAILDIRS